mmetsp:Transcript_11279/g.12880  ORF Transcript_11279/g.12880 Transcript_11279/m.12880 type:complete len:232 (+) Transcript_11279:104-799(+)
MEPKQEEQDTNEEIKTTEGEKVSKKAELGYPKQVVYCPKCGLPPEYCEYGPNFANCIPWLRENYPQFAPQGQGGEEETKVQAQPAGEENVSKKSKTKEAGKIIVEKSNRSARKYLTVVSGLDKHGIVVKDAAKKFGKKFACGSSVIEDNAIEIQGDVVLEVIDYILKEYKDLKREMFEIKEKKKPKEGEEKPEEKAAAGGKDKGKDAGKDSGKDKGKDKGDDKAKKDKPKK